MRITVATVILSAAAVQAQLKPWEQCGGDNWTKPTQCVDGYACTFFNHWYSQCLRSTTTVTSVPASSTTASVSASAALPTATGTDTPLHAAATAAGKLYFGTATDNGELSDAPYKAILSNTTLFGQITPSNSMKWVRRLSFINCVSRILTCVLRTGSD